MSLLHKSLLIMAALAAGCQVEKVRDAELPDIQLEGGQLPKIKLKSTKERIRIRMDTSTVADPTAADTVRR